MVESSSTSPNELPAPRKIIPYPITNDPKGGSLFLYGESDSPTKVIFCAGYPDDHKNGQLFCSNLAKQSKSLVGLMCLPGYDEPWMAHQQNNPDGFTFDQMISAVREAVKALCNESTNDQSNLTGIFHDWGVMPGLMWSNRALLEGEQNDNDNSSINKPDQLVIFDVLGPVHKDQRKDVPPHETKVKLYDTIVTFTYRLVSAISFLLQRHISKYIALPFFILCNIILTVLRIGPCYDMDIKSWQTSHKNMNPFRMIYMAYPYWYMFKGMFTSTKGSAVFGDFTLPKDLSKTPVLYMYGNYKRIMFHDNGSVAYLEREAKEGRSKSNAIALEDAGHWLYLQKPDRCLKEVMHFMSK